MIAEIIIIVVVAFIILPVVTALLGFPIGVYNNIFGDQHKYSLRDYIKDVQPFDDPFLAGCERLQLKREYVSITARDGINLVGEIIDNHSQKTIIYIHGYRSNPQRDFAYICPAFLKEGYNVLLIHQRAHALSGGKHCTGGVNEQYDVQSWLSWCCQNSFGREYVLYGISMGGSTIGFGCENWDGERVKALVIDCAFTSICYQMNDMAEGKLPKWLIKFVMNMVALFAKVNLKADIKKTVCQCLEHNVIPVAFLGGTADVTVSVEMVKKNYQACGGRKVLLIAEGAPHGKVFRDDDTREKLFDFLKECQV